jgi:hypothetical protein
MIRSAFALLLFSLLVGCYRQGEGIVVPYDHPADPYARPAPPIAVAPIEAPDIESVAPEVGEMGAKPAPKKDSPGGAAPHQHH